MRRSARAITDAFDGLRYCASSNGGAPVDAGDFSSAKAAKSALAALGPSLARIRAHPTLLEWERDQKGLAQAVDRFDGVRTGRDLFDAVLNHHEHVQREKPPNGKRPWFERGPRGKVVVRSGYTLREPPDEEGGYVHEYRIPTFSGFLTDLGSSPMRSATLVGCGADPCAPARPMERRGGFWPSAWLRDNKLHVRRGIIRRAMPRAIPVHSEQPERNGESLSDRTRGKALSVLRLRAGRWRACGPGPQPTLAHVACYPAPRRRVARKIDAPGLGELHSGLDRLGQSHRTCLPAKSRGHGAFRFRSARESRPRAARPVRCLPQSRAQVCAGF